jgi:hypothetical protein
MVPFRYLLTGVAVLAAAMAPQRGYAAESQKEDDAVRHDDIRAEICKLLAADTAKVAAVASPSVNVAAGNPPAAGTVVMSPYIVREAKVQDIADSVYSPPILQLIENGTLLHTVGKKFTTNIVLHFYTTDQMSGGNIRPKNGVEVGCFWSW